MSNFGHFLGNATSGSTKRCIDLDSASIYSSYCILHYSDILRYNTTKYQWLLTNFIYLGSPKNQKPYILRKPEPFQLSLLQGIFIIYLYGLQS